MGTHTVVGTPTQDVFLVEPSPEARAAVLRFEDLGTQFLASKRAEERVKRLGLAVTPLRPR